MLAYMYVYELLEFTNTSCYIALNPRILAVATSFSEEWASRSFYFSLFLCRSSNESIWSTFQALCVHAIFHEFSLMNDNTHFNGPQDDIRYINHNIFLFVQNPLNENHRYWKSVALFHRFRGKLIELAQNVLGLTFTFAFAFTFQANVSPLSFNRKMIHCDLWLMIYSLE